jgi:hypothetical protein
VRGIALAAASLALAGLACNKGPAEEALGFADQQIAAARPELEANAPGELEALTAEVGQARAQLEQGQYTDALRAAQKLPARVRAALAVAALEKQRRVGEWSGLAASVPGLLRTIATRIDWLVENEKLPRGMDEAGLAAARTELESVSRAWSEAASLETGDVTQAVARGRAAKARAEVVAASVGLSPAGSQPPGSTTPASPPPQGAR